MTGSRPILTLPPRPTLTAQRLKVTPVLNADELIVSRRLTAKRAPPCASACPIANSPPTSRPSRCEAQAAIREAGADAIALVLRGCLVEGDVIAEAGLSAQPKAKHSNDEGNGDCA